MGDFLNLHDFTIKEEIGKGALGKVYKIAKTSTGKIYAAKVSLTEYTDDKKAFTTTLKQEISIISQLNHPCILKLIGYSPTNFKQESYPVIVTEYAPNGSLENILQLERQSLSPTLWNDTKKLINIYGIASAMSFLHDHDIIHKDLKPSNILEDDYLFPKITDFGLSKINQKNDDKSTPGTKGAPFYIAPENWENKDYSKASDVYSFSMIVYEILTLEEPFKNYSITDYFSKVIQKGDRPEFKSPIAPCYKELIERCWSQNKEERPSFKEILSTLKTKQEFITNGIDKGEFFDYIDLIDNHGNSFDPSKKFQKVVAANIEELEKNLTDFQKLSRIKGYEKLPKEIRDFFESEMNNSKYDKKTIKISSEVTKKIYDNGLFQSQDFKNVIEFFNTILVDVEYDIDTVNDFKSIYNSLIDLSQNESNVVKINIITSYISNIKEFLQQKEATFSVSVSSSVKSICENAFNECSLMTQITIPNSVTSFKSNAFSECSLLEQISIPSSLTEIGEACFFQCSSITTFSIPSKITKINDFTFQQCSKLSKITIPSSVTSIGDYAFDKCVMLSELSIPSSVSKIGDFAFRECLSLKHVIFDIHSSLTSIGDFAFRGCVSLTIMEFPQYVTSIGEFAFKNCSSLFNISLSYNVSSVGNNSFEGCDSLAQITIPFTAPLKKAGQEDTSIISQIMNPTAAKRKIIGIGTEVKIVKSTKCCIY